VCGSEVNAALKALRAYGLNVVAIHHHMMDTLPRFFSTTAAAAQRPGLLWLSLRWMSWDSKPPVAR